MEILIAIVVVGAFIFSASFRSNVSRTMESANRALKTANDALATGLDEIEASLPKAKTKLNSENKEITQESKEIKKFVASLDEIEASLPKAEIKPNSIDISQQEISSNAQCSDDKETTKANKETKEHINGFWIVLFIILGIGVYVYIYFETSKATTQTIQKNTTIQENNTLESVGVKPKKTEIRPKSTIWVGIIYLDTKKRVSMMLNAPLEIDTSREQTILTGHGMLELDFNGKTSSYHSAKRMRFYVNKEGQIKIINQAEYNRYNGDLKW